MQVAISQARERWGAIDGVIHAAGIAGAGRLASLKSRQDVADVLSPKLDGLDVLVQLLGATALDFVVLMSSVNAVLGAPGLADYGAANAVLDAFVESSDRPPQWRHVVALDWGPWQDVGMAARLTIGSSQRKRQGRVLGTHISPAQGVDAFERALTSHRERLVVVPFDLNDAVANARETMRSAALAVPVNAALPAPPSSPAATDARPVPGSAVTDVEQCISAIWTEMLGVERIGLTDDFFDLGGHSLLATRVLARIDDRLGVRLSLRDVFDAPTVKGLAEKVAAVAPASPGDDREEVEF
jgi:acyl carrier protein